MNIKAYAKVNIFLKITGYKDGYHTLTSRFMRVNHLFDDIAFVPHSSNDFVIEGCQDIPIQKNTITKAYNAIQKHTNSLKLKEFFKAHKVVVEKHIPSQAGLGGGSSDAAAFLNLANQVCNLGIDTEQLAQLSSTIGSDVPFFVYNYPSANVKGFGEVVEPFNEKMLDLDIMTPLNISCYTAKVYESFHKYLLSTIDPTTHFGWESLDSQTILSIINNPVALNDLYPAAMATYPELETLQTSGWFFSGSGSSFFREKPRT